MASEDVEEVGRAARLKAVPLAGLGGRVLIDDAAERVLAVRFVLDDGGDFLFAWPAARALQHRDRLLDALDREELTNLPRSLSPAQDLYLSRVGLLCRETERFRVPADLHSRGGLAREAHVWVLPPDEAVVDVETKGGRSTCVVLDLWAVYMFVAMVNGAEACGLIDDDVRPRAR